MTDFSRNASHLVMPDVKDVLASNSNFEIELVLPGFNSNFDAATCWAYQRQPTPAKTMNLF